MTQPFTVVFRGYDRPQVDQLLALADQALASGSETAHVTARSTLSDPMLRVTLRGYERPAVEQAISERLTRLGGPLPAPAPTPDDASLGFTTVLRGYSLPEVEQLFARVERALAAGDTAAARQALSTAEFAIVLRGYDRGEVDEEVQRRLKEL
ncbi:hypothetical protein AB0M54_28445 [Actinoplanes sp. NPDC051470]|uniref:hypothetical protein n=1 Tax=unclassified Actinoplanes TaxID=2626549 RepID=UPI00342AA73A